MKIHISVKPSAKKESVEKIDDTHFKISVKEPPTDGRANWAVERALAAHLGVAPSRVSVVKGHTSRQKVAEIR